jgi:hypothetical protein
VGVSKLWRGDEWTGEGGGGGGRLTPKKGGKRGNLELALGTHFPVGLLLISCASSHSQECQVRGGRMQETD